MPDSGTSSKKHVVTDSSVLDAFNNGDATLVQESKGAVVTDPSILDAFNSGDASLVKEVKGENVMTDKGEVSVKPGSETAKALQPTTNDVAKDLSYATSVMNKLYGGQQFAPPKESISISKNGITEQGQPSTQTITYNTKGNPISDKREVGITPEIVKERQAINSLDISKYVTKLSNADESKYQQWKATLPSNLQYEGDYDLRGYWKKYGTANLSSEGHLTDEFKLPNHQTFSDESKYFNDETRPYAGKWIERNGKSVYAPYNPLVKESLNQHQETPVSGNEKEAAQIAIKKETDTPAQIIGTDLQETINSLPLSAQDALKTVGITPDLIHRVVNTNGDTEALKQYFNQRLPLLEQQKQQELQALNNKPIGYTFTAEDERIHKEQAAQIDQKYQQKEDELHNAAFNLAAQKIVNQKIQDNQGNMKTVDPYEIGMEVQKTLGGEAETNRQLKEIRQGIVDPTEKYQRGLIGYRALQYAGMTAAANGDEQAANSIAELTDNYKQKLIAGNPEYVKNQVVEAISNKLYEDKQGLGSFITGYTPSQEDVQKTGKELGIREEDLKNINPEDIKRESNALTSFGQQVGSTFFAPLVEGLGRHILNPIAQAFGEGYTQEQLNQKYDNNWYYNSEFGKMFGGQQPTAGTLLAGGQKVETSPNSDQYLMTVSDDNSSKWNWNIGSVGNTVINGAAQIIGNAVGARAVGGALTGIGAIKNAELADRIGNFGYIYANSYDNSYKQTPQDIPEANRVALANVYAVVEGLSEQIFPDYKITDKVLNATTAGRQLIDKISKEGLQAVDKATFTNSLKDAAIEWAKDTGKEGIEEFVTPFGQAAGDIFFAPKQYDQEKGTLLQNAWQQGVVGAVSAALPVGVGAIQNIRQRGPMGTSALYDVGKNSNTYIDAINKEVNDGQLDQTEANQKIQVVNTLSNIVKNSVPDQSIVNNQTLTPKQKADYTYLRLQEATLNERKKTVQDPVQEKYIDEQLNTIQQQKENILQNAGEQRNNKNDLELNITKKGQPNIPNDENGITFEGLTGLETVKVPEGIWRVEKVQRWVYKALSNENVSDSDKEKITQWFDQVRENNYSQLKQETDGQNSQGENNGSEAQGINETEGNEGRQNVLTAPSNQETQVGDSGQVTVGATTGLPSVNDFEEEEPINNQEQQLLPEHQNIQLNATQESVQQQQEGNTTGGISQHQGTVPGQPEIREGEGEQRQTAQSETDSSHSLQRSEIQKEIRPRPVLEYTTKSGNQKVVTSPSGILKVVNSKTGEDVSTATRRNAIKEAAESYDFNNGNEVVLPENTEEWKDEDYSMYIAENSNSPRELAIIATKQEPEGHTLSAIENAIIDFGDITTTNQSYARFGDRNNITRGKALKYLNNKTGAPIDEIARELSAHSGLNIEPQDIVDFIDRFPNGIKQATRSFPNKIAETASKRFEELTGFPLTESIANIALSQGNNFSPSEIDFLNKEYDSREQLEQEFYKAIAEGRLNIEAENGLLHGTSEEISPGGTKEVTEPGGQSAEPSTGPEKPANESGSIGNAPEEKTINQQLTDVVNEINDLTPKIPATQQALDELRKIGKENSDDFKRKYEVFKSLNKKLKLAEQKHKLLSAKLLAQDIRSKKIKNTGLALSTPLAIPVALYNAAIETAALALEAGAHIKVAIQQAVDFINGRLHTNWDETKFRDILGDNMSFPFTASELREKKTRESTLSKKNEELANQFIEKINNRELTLPQVLDDINKTGLSPALKDKLSQYIRNNVTEANKKEGMAESVKLINDNGQDYDAALQQLEHDTDTALLNAATDVEKFAIRQKYAATKSAIQSQKTEAGIKSGSIKPVSIFSNNANNVQGGFELPSQTFWQKKRQELQDRFQRLQQGQTNALKEITQETDAVSGYRLAKARAWAKVNDIREYLGDTKYVKGSFYDRLKKAGIDIRQFGLYLYAKHAPERNAKNAADRQRAFDGKVYQINEELANTQNAKKIDELKKELDDILSQKNPDYVLMPDGGSGMTNEQASGIVDEVEKDGNTDKFDKFAEEFKQNVIDPIVDFKYESGLLTDNEYNAIKNAYKNYVPLKFDLDEELKDKDGKPLSASGKRGRDLYRSKGAVEQTYESRNNPVLQAVVDLEYSMMKGEENLANIRMANLIRENPNEAIWEIKKPQYEVVNDKNGNVVFAAEKFAPKDGIPFWESGQKSYIVINDPTMKETFKKIKPTQALRVMQNITGTVRLFSTLTNPAFIVTNPMVDVQDATAYLRGEANPEVIKNYLRDLKIYPKIAKQILGGKGEWADIRKEWEKEGGNVTFSKQVNIDEQAAKTLKIFENYDKPLSIAQVKKTLSGFRNLAETLEVTTRVLVYKSAIDAGYSKEKAALLSREATIDFEKSGTQGIYINAFKAFMNAGIQGTVGTAQLLRRSKILRKIVGGMVVAGMAQAWISDLLSDCDENPEDCYWEVPEWKKQRNIVITTGVAQPITIPIGRRLGWFNYLGQNAYGLMKYFSTNGEKGTSPGDFVVNTFSSFFDYYNPTGGTAPLLQQAAGNFAPVVGLASNKNAFGTQIKPTNYQGGPEHLNFFPTTPKAYVEISNALSKITGGGDGKEGKMEISPNDMQYVVQSIFSGLGSFVGGVYNTVQKAASPDEKVQAADIPILNRFFRESNMSVTKQKKGELVEKAKTEILTDEEQSRLEGYLNDLEEGGQITEDQRKGTLKFVHNKQRASAKRIKKYEDESDNSE